ncbi:MAG: HAD-IA family hydrolase, partial [Plesiomonas shigelloides]
SADRVYLSNEMGWRKPQPQIYQQVLADTGFTPAQSCFFDDNADNIAAARALGIESVWVKDAQTVLEYFRQRDLGA